MKGLDWFQVESDIAHDGEIEYVSDAAFRTFFELIATASEDLSDGRVPLQRAERMCKSTQFDAAITELVHAKYIKRVGDVLVVVNYKKHNPTRAEVLRMREKTKERVTRYRTRSNAVSNGVGNAVCNAAKEKSRVEIEKEEEKEEKDGLVRLALDEVWASESTSEDWRRTIDRYRPTLPDEQIARVIRDLANWTPKTPRKKAHLTLANWLSKESPPLLPQVGPNDSSPYQDIDVPEWW